MSCSLYPLKLARIMAHRRATRPDWLGSQHRGRRARSASSARGAQRVDQQVLVRVVGEAAERAEPVDRQRHVRGDVAGVAGAAASGAGDRPAEQLAGPRQRRGGDLARVERRARAAAARPGSRRRRARWEPRRGRPRSSTSRSARMSTSSSPPAGTALIASPARIIVGTTRERLGPAGSWSAREPLRHRRRARAARCGRRRGWRRSERRRRRPRPGSPTAALRLTTTASVPSASRSPPSKQRQASKPSNRGPWTKGEVRNSSSLTSRSADLGERARCIRRGRAGRRARARPLPSCRSCPSRRSRLPSIAAGRWRSWATTVSRWPTSRTRRSPVPAQRREQVGRVVGRGARDPLDRRGRRAASRSRRRPPARRRPRRPRGSRSRPARPSPSAPARRSRRLGAARSAGVVEVGAPSWRRNLPGADSLAAS